MSSTRNIVIFGIDNVVRDTAWRYHMIPVGRDKQDSDKWLAFHKAGVKDEPIKAMLHMVHTYIHDPEYDVYFWGNAMEECREDIRKWLSHHGITGRSYKQLFLRPDGVKLPNREVYERWVKGMPQGEIERVKLVISHDPDMLDVFANHRVDTLKVNGVSAF